MIILSTKDDRYNRNLFIYPIRNKEISHIQAYFSRMLDDDHQNGLLDRRDRTLTAFYNMFFDTVNEYNKNLYGLFLDDYTIIKIWDEYFSKDLMTFCGNIRRPITRGKKQYTSS